MNFLSMRGSTGKSFHDPLTNLPPTIFVFTPCGDVRSPQEESCYCRTCRHVDPSSVPSPRERHSLWCINAVNWLWDKQAAGWKKESIPDRLFIITLLFQTPLNRSYRNSPSVRREIEIIQARAYVEFSVEWARFFAPIILR